MKNRLSMLIYPDKSFYRSVIAIALPIALQNTITLGVNLTDTLMVGALGETYLSATSLANQLIMVMQSLTMGVSMGASVLIARYWGMQKMESLKKTIAIQLRLVMLIAAFFSLATLLAPDFIMRIFTDEEAIIRQGVIFLRYSVITYFFQGASVACTIVLRNIKKVKIPMMVSLGAFFVNIIGNYAFMFGKLGAPRLGIGGAAVSTLLVRIFECIFICGYLFAVDQNIRFRPKDLLVKTGDLLPEYIRISVPVLVSDFLLAMANSIVMMIIGRMGESFVAANAVTAVVVNITSVVIQGIGQASSIITGNTLGEGKREAVQRQGYAFFGLGIGIGLLMGLLILPLSPLMIRLYHLSAETAAITRQLMYAIAIINVFQSTNNILTKGTLRGGGDTKTLMVADSIFLWAAAIPLGLVAGMWLHAPAFWVYICLKSDNVFKCIWCWFRLKSGKWIKKIRALPE